MKRAFILFLAAIMLLTCLAGCGGNTATEAGGGSSTSSAIELALDTFHPPRSTPHEFPSINEYSVVFNIYEPLVYVMDDGSEQFLMAESYEVSEDGRVYTFQLRSGVKFHNGEVMTADDVVFSLESAVADPYMATYVSANSDYRSGSTTQDLVQWLVLNSEAAPLDDVRVRQAVYSAINKEDVLAIAANRAGTAANVMADPRIIAGATDDFSYLTFDQEKARSLLAEAGYPDGVDIGEITYVGGTSWEKIAAAVQSNLADVGITVTMKSMDASAIFSSLASGDFTVGVLGSGLGRDYSLYSQLYTMDYLDVLDMCRLQDPEVDSKFAEAAITVDKTVREAIYKDLIQQLETGAYYIPVFYEDFIWASDPGFTPFIDDGALMIYRCTME